MNAKVNLIYRGRGIGAVCLTCKEEVCVNPRNEIDINALNRGTCSICGATAKVVDPTVFGGIHPQLA